MTCGTATCAVLAEPRSTALVLARGLDAAGAFAELRERGGWSRATRERGPRRERPTETPPAPLPSDDELDGWAQCLLVNQVLIDRLYELRGWTRSALAGLAVGFDGSGRDGPRLTFPIRDRDGELVNVCRYTPNPKAGERKMLSLSGRPRDLFPPPETIDGDDAWIFEGEPDGITAATIGLPAVAIPGVEFAKRIDPGRFRRFARVNVALDCDRPGRDAAAGTAETLVGAAVEARVIDLDPSRDDGYDLSDMVRAALAEGQDVASIREQLKRMADNATPLQPAASALGANGEARRARRSSPDPLSDAAFHGLAGEIVKTIEPHTEADVAAVLVSFLAAFGNVIGRTAGFKFGPTFHATNLYVLLVGPTSSGRKGTAGDEVARVFAKVDKLWSQDRVVSGLSTGEGLIWQVRDPITRRRKTKKGEVSDLPDGWLEEIDDPGEPDKRLLVVEAEFAQALKVMQREGNTLSPTLRRLWDRGDARSMVKTSPGRTTDSLVSITGHISVEELRRQLRDAEIANGFANRFAIVCSRRSKRLPFGGSLEDRDLAAFIPRLRRAIESARQRRELGMDQSARAAWREMYRHLDEERFGILGAAAGIRRAVPIVCRIAVIYALLDCDTVVREHHLRAAAAVWRYCVESARYVFGDAVGSALADKLRIGLRDAGAKWLSRDQIRRNVIRSNNVRAAQIEDALQLLLDHGLVEHKVESTGGKPAELWRSAEIREEREETPPVAPQEGLSSHSSKRPDSATT